MIVFHLLRLTSGFCQSASLLAVCGIITERRSVCQPLNVVYFTDRRCSGSCGEAGITADTKTACHSAPNKADNMAGMTNVLGVLMHDVTRRVMQH